MGSAGGGQKGHKGYVITEHLETPSAPEGQGALAPIRDPRVKLSTSPPYDTPHPTSDGATTTLVLRIQESIQPDGPSNRWGSLTNTSTGQSLMLPFPGAIGPGIL